MCRSLSRGGRGAPKIIFFYIFLVLPIIQETHALVSMSHTVEINREKKTPFNFTSSALQGERLLSSVDCFPAYLFHE